MTERDLRRWSREVAEDPGAPSFVRLARAYRREGRHESARDVVLGGLRANPEHVDGHALLALIHIERGDRQQARDEWETVLRLDPGNFDASRGLGFLALERGDLPAAERHLEAAARARPENTPVRQALEVLADRQAAARADGPAGTAAVPRDPDRLFEPLADAGGPFLGAVVVDRQGMVLAGGLRDDRRTAELLGGLLGVAVAEARRTARILELGAWDWLLLETDEATLHVTGLETGAAVVVVTHPDAPAGWVVRTAARARGLAEAFVREEP